ncbi:transmembrane protein 182-like [Electrophorus electricus]|uniref:transmembrane protein 182-like n=1 Tax=Electrophorus electricus TaxID=8005 RepID=UPI000F09E56E|nr:transmembrane protein 182-like [Electrophorus electricus]
MKTGVAALAAGLVGGLGVLCFLLAFSTDYWLLASNKCVGLRKESSSMVGIKEQANSTEVMETTDHSLRALTLHHEGFFWRYNFQADLSLHTVWAVLFTNQPQSKTCVRGYLFPLPVAVGRVPHHIYDATVVFRGFWTMLTVLAIVASITGGFLLVCAVPFISPKLYKEQGNACPRAHLEAHYGWSSMAAAAGIPLVLHSGLLIFWIGRCLQKRT